MESCASFRFLSKLTLLDDSISLSISILSVLYTSLNYKIIEMGQFLFFYFIVDLFLFKKRIDIIIHHLIAILTYYKIYLLNLPKNDFEQFCKIIILLEVSSIFLLTKKIIREHNIICSNKIKSIINILFVSTFMYFRIYNYYYYLLSKNQILDIIINDYSLTNFNKCFFYSSFYGFYLLNLYWTTLIFKKIYKSYIKN